MRFVSERRKHLMYIHEYQLCLLHFAPVQQRNLLCYSRQKITAELLFGVTRWFISISSRFLTKERKKKWIILYINYKQVSIIITHKTAGGIFLLNVCHFFSTRCLFYCFDTMMMMEPLAFLYVDVGAGHQEEVESFFYCAVNYTRKKR